MSEARAFGEARQVGNKENLISGKAYDIPDGATHVLVRPVRRGIHFNVFIAFYRCGLPDNYKPQNNAGKFFYRPNGAKKCRVNASHSANGWRYEVDWLE